MRTLKLRLPKNLSDLKHGDKCQMHATVHDEPTEDDVPPVSAAQVSAASKEGVTPRAQKGGAMAYLKRKKA
jgi:hypothetical protein